MSKPILLVTSASGRIGKELVSLLGRSGSFRVRALTHDTSPDKKAYLEKLGADEVVHFDLNDESTYKEATDGAEYIYSASLDPLLTGHLSFSKFLGGMKDQIKQVVRVSCMGADTNTASYDSKVHASRPGAEVPLMLQHYWWGEECLISAGLPVTALRNNFFMNHLLKTETDNIDQHGFFTNPLGNMRNSFVSTTDIATAAFHVFKDGPSLHANKYYDLTGPKPQNMYEIAEDLGKAMGKKIEYRPQDMVQFEKDFGPTRAEFFEYLVNGFYTRCSPDFYNITGKKPTAYYDYLTQKGPSGETGLDELYQGNLWKKGEDAMAKAANLKK